MRTNEGEALLGVSHLYTLDTSYEGEGFLYYDDRHLFTSDENSEDSRTLQHERGLYRLHALGATDEVQDLQTLEFLLIEGLLHARDLLLWFDITQRQDEWTRSALLTVALRELVTPGGLVCKR